MRWQPMLRPLAGDVISLSDGAVENLSVLIRAFYLKLQRLIEEKGQININDLIVDCNSERFDTKDFFISCFVVTLDHLLRF